MVKSSNSNDCLPSEPDVILNPLPANPLKKDGDEMLPDVFMLPPTSSFSLGLNFPMPIFPLVDALNNKSPFEIISASWPVVFDVESVNLVVPVFFKTIFEPLPSLSDMICVYSSWI